MKLVADALEEDHRAICEKLPKAMGVKTLQENAQEWTSVAHGWATHSPWRYSPAYRGCCNQKLCDYVWEVLLHAPSNPDRLQLIPKVKRTYAWTTFSSLEELSTDGTRVIRHMNKSSVLDGIIIIIIMFPKH